jgi:hypothetical protein
MHAEMGTRMAERKAKVMGLRLVKLRGSRRQKRSAQMPYLPQIPKYKKTVRKKLMML